MLLQDWLDCLAVFEEGLGFKGLHGTVDHVEAHFGLLMDQEVTRTWCCCRYNSQTISTQQIRPACWEYNTRFTAMVSDPATGRTVTGFSMHVLLATLMRTNKISLDFVFSSRNIDIYFREVQDHATCIKRGLFSHYIREKYIVVQLVCCH